MAFTWSDERVRMALGLRLDRAEPDVAYNGVSTDSRTIAEGELYVALVGERFDGHDFVADALSAGAAGAVVSAPSPGVGTARIYPVADTLVALGRLAAHRRAWLGVPVVAVTGSSGKTTTKNMTAATVGATRRVHATEGNLNNRVGMPLTLLRTPEDAEAVVLELGTNEPGEIRALAQVARPDIGVVTTVGASHLERLGSVEGVLEEKLDLLRYLAVGGRCIVGDEPPVLATRARALCSVVRVVGWSARADEDLRPGSPEMDATGRFTFFWKGARAVAPVAGRHGVADAMLALAVADLLGVSPEDAVRGLGQTSLGTLRGETRRLGDLTVIVDCYNANPQSVRAALSVLESQRAATRKVAVLGTMLELGDASDDLHREVLADALSRGLDLVVATGAFCAAADGLGEETSNRLLTAVDWPEAYPALRNRLAGDEIVLLKASRGVRMEGLLELLESDYAPPGARRQAD